MKTSRQIEHEAKQLFRLCTVNGSLDESLARQVVQRVIASKRRGYLALLSRFQRLVRLEQEAHAAVIESATPLTEDLRTNVQARLKDAYGTGITFRFVQKPALIGGMRVKVGSDVYDGSVQSELAALERSF